MIEKKFDHIVESMNFAKDNNIGCSVKAGVPTAKEFVEIIMELFPAKLIDIDNKTYAKCMGALSPLQRKIIISKYVDKAKINWAHIAIAQLMDNKFIDRVLTTNFDMLVVRACSLIGLNPATYDFATSQLLKFHEIREQAIFHLHGQRTGFVLMNTDPEVNKHAETMEKVFEGAGQGRLWIVVGYSGENDPVFNQLAKTPQFDNDLYWVCYKDEDPVDQVCKELLIEDKCAYTIKGYDADSFFIKLAQKLDCFPPDIAGKPFAHLLSCLKNVTEYPMKDEAQDQDILAAARTIIEDAEKNQEKNEEIAISNLYMEGNYAEVIKLGEQFDDKIIPEMKDMLSSSYFTMRYELDNKADIKTGMPAQKLYSEACENYRAALKIEPNNHMTLNNLGLAIFKLSQTKSGKVDDEQYEQIFSMYKAALKINSDEYIVLYNWGLALYGQADEKSNTKADDLYAEAYAKFKAAVKLKPDDFKILYNWGLSLSDQAVKKLGEEADDLFAQAYTILR